MHTVPSLILRTATLCLCALLPFALQAKKHYYLPPKAILVQLSTESNRAAHFAQSTNGRSMAQLQQDAQAVIDKTVMDFSDNFYYCPVYFFMDTCAGKIRAGKFAGVLLDKDMRPAQGIVLHEGDSSFFIGYYGPRITDVAGMDETEYYRHHNDMNTHIPHWVMLDHHFRALRSPFPWSIEGIKAPKGRRMKQPSKAYVYNSPKFNISYAPSALQYSAMLETFYKKHGRSRK